MYIKNEAILKDDDCDKNRNLLLLKCLLLPLPLPPLPLVPLRLLLPNREKSSLYSTCGNGSNILVEVSMYVCVYVCVCICVCDIILMLMMSIRISSVTITKLYHFTCIR